MTFDGKTAEEALNDLRKLRTYQPFRYGGKWFIAAIGETTYAYRNKQSLIKRAAKAGLASIELIVIS